MEQSSGHLVGNSAIVVIASALLSGCAVWKPVYDVRPLPTQNLILINSLGDAVDPTGNIWCKHGNPPQLANNDRYKYVQPRENEQWHACNGGSARFLTDRPLRADYKQYLDDLFASMRTYLQSKPAGQRKVVIFIHGGLNNEETSLGRARDQSRQIIEDGYYPIFINWKSSLGVNLLEHLFVIRQGAWRRSNWWTAGPVFVSDLSRAAFRAPSIWHKEIGNEVEVVRQMYFKKHETVADHARNRLRELQPKPDCPAIAVSKGGDELHLKDMVVPAVDNLATVAPARIPVHGIRALLHTVFSHTGTHVNAAWTWVPTKALASIVLDGLGSPAWDNMIRSSKLTFQNRGERKSGGEDEKASPPPEGSGAAAEFFRRLAAAKTQDPSIEITIIGHSMGAFLINRAVMKFPDLEFKHVVYLAAACPLGEYEDASQAYLRRHKETTWHHLTLNPIAERRESDVMLTPRGSLLMWIDTFFSQPATLLDRTAGRYENLMPELETTPCDIRGQITAKTFAVDPDHEDEIPQTHGSFSDAEFRYWRPEFWRP